jgi:hypothetical protein
MWLITPSNFLAITRTHNIMQTPKPYQRLLRLYYHRLGSFEFVATHVVLQASYSQSTFITSFLETWPPTT